MNLSSNQKPGYRDFRKPGNDRGNKAYLSLLEAELKEVQRKLDNMIKAIEDGIYTETTRGRLMELETRRDALDQAIMVEQAKNELFQDAGFGEFYKRYLDADLENPELRDELLDYFVAKIYIDDDGKLSFVLKLYDKDGVELQEVSEDELFDFVGVEVFDNFAPCSTRKPCRSIPARFFRAHFSVVQSMQILHSCPWYITQGFSFAACDPSHLFPPGHTRLANTPRILRLIIPFSLVTGFGGRIAIVCRV